MVASAKRLGQVRAVRAQLSLRRRRRDTVIICRSDSANDTRVTMFYKLSKENG